MDPLESLLKAGLHAWTSCLINLQTMKSAFYDKNLTVEIRDVPVPKPQAGQVLIRVVASGVNPKDWKQPKHWAPETPPSNHGDDIAGYVEATGPGVTSFHPGDRVAAFHELWTPHGSFAEYAIAWARSTFHLGDNVSFEGLLCPSHQRLHQ
jgi:NADPH2:quinone reductase